jgi:hypothetical protein
MMTPLFPSHNRVGTVVKAAAFGVVLANAGIASLDAKPISPPPDLVSWWPGDRNARDVIGSNDGLLKGGASFKHGLVKQAFSLDGINDFVSVPDSSSLRFGTNDFTVDLWINFRTTEGEQVLIEKFVSRLGGPNSEGWTLTKLEGDTMLSGAVIAGNDVDVPLTVLPNTWYFVAVSRFENDYTMYWDGVPVGSNSFIDNLDSSAALKFGHRCSPEDTPGCDDDRGFFLNGLIDEMEIFNRALSEDEILDIFEAGRDGQIKPRTHK